MNYSDLHAALDEAAYEVLQNYQKRMYRIEKRSESGFPTFYWNDDIPEGGIWVKLEEK